MLPLLTLKRIGSSSDGMTGVLVHNKRITEDRIDYLPFCVTMERDHADAAYKPIRAGDYLCVKYSSARYPSTFEIVDLPGSNLLAGRSKILFHWGNWEDDSKGCIILGEQFEPMKGKIAVLQSKKAFEEFLEITNGLEEFRFRILEWIN